MRKLVVIHDPADIVPIIRREAKLAGRTQKQIAEHLGFTEKHVSYLFNGRNGVSIDVLLRLCGYLEVGVAFYPSAAS
ncbi:helix-turn-helix DNA binding domain protein [Arthrobacter phage EastWest]|uniref:Helix-turn-helix DNA binding domain protein n=1 Tax=Arthrobacter phage EastWest TaxID=2894292 RepID=A0AAE9C8U0_9CAUD|nr:helix-turn-helix DNA binding domain protein [Arthrobacter phage EastWest]